MLTDVEKLNKRLAREKLARQSAEDLLEKKAMELYEKNKQLAALTENLEKKVANRTLEMQRARDEAILASKIKSDFIANISHELRTPMNGVLGMLSLLADEDLNQDQLELLRTAKASGEQLLLLINDVLDFTKIEENKLELSFAPVNLKELFNVVCKPFEIQANQKDIELHLNLSENVPDIIITDKLRMTQIISNLLSNAVKFTKKGHIDVDLECESITGNLATFCLTVKDTGIGISEQGKGSVFSAFEQADSSITRDFGGTGLGMSITKRLVDKFNGEIKMSSQLGKGTSFTITVAFEIGEQPFDRCANNENFDRSFGTRNILLVEDNKINQIVAEKMLTKQGVTLTIAENGKQAIELLENNVFDLIFMDLQMPVMGGIEAVKQIRNRGLIDIDTPIVAMTAHNTQTHIDECLDVGMQGHISKPIENDKLTKILIKFLNVNIVQSTETTKKVSKTIDGIDLTEGLKRLHGDWVLYYSLIERFLTENEQVVANLRALQRQDNSERLREIFHKLKGSAANLAIANVSRIAANFETKLRQVPALLPTEQELNELESEINRTFESFKELENPHINIHKADIRTESSDYIIKQMDSILYNLNRDVLASEESLHDLMQCELTKQALHFVNEAHAAMSIFDLDTVSRAITQAKNTLV